MIAVAPAAQAQKPNAPLRVRRAYVDGRFGLAIQPGREFELINPDDDPRYRAYVQTYLDLAGRRGITPLGGYCATKFAVVALSEALRSSISEALARG